LRHRGFTLIEVIVAITIFAMMVVIATSALNQTLNQFQKLQKQGVNFWENSKTLWLNRSLACMCDYYVKNDNNLWFPYFIGTSNEISYVSLAPFANNLPVAVWLIRKQNSDGSFSLDYYETPVYTKNFQDLKTIYTFGDYKKFTYLNIIKDAKSISFDYYGYDLRLKKEVWSQTYEGEKKYFLPSLIQITYQLKDSDSKDVMVFFVHANSTLKGSYNELYAK
jgi:general secretion pathway protein J